MKRRYLLKTGINTSRISRLLAKAVDLFIVLILSTLFYPFGLILALAYIGVSDSLYDGQSVGKKLMGFAVISLEDGKPCSMKQSVIRNLPIMVPMVFAIIPLWGWIFCSILAVPLILLEVYLLFKLDSGHRLGDVMADTSVIANDPNRIDIRKAQQGWFEEKNMSPCNRCTM
ncbi:MAG: RDD family protein [Bacteriovoracaceae bacterium]|nr:RDD family protein [Bacteriovoracaceae bacterium]